jgi:class 3 adenylate cyclase/predicted esterase
VGNGPPLVRAAHWLSHLEFDWRSPVWRHWLEELSHDHTYVRYDERGCGLSDWQVEDFSFEAWVRDLEAVVDTLGLERFPILGVSQGGPVAITYAVRHPERVSHLVLYGTYASGTARRNLSTEAQEEMKALVTLTGRGWGRDDASYRQIFTTKFIPEASPEQVRWFNDLQRMSTSPENAVKFLRAFAEIDVSHLLPEVRVPTLVLHAREDALCPFELGRRLAAGIQDAKFVPLESRNHVLLEDEPAWATFVSEVRRFLGVTESKRLAESGVHTILFTDVEGSTALTERLGDAGAREVLREHERIVREALAAHGGAEVKTMGDGFMATFASASRALECAIQIQRGFAERNASAETAINVRVGLNAGEPISEADAQGRADLFGTAVNMAARIAGQAVAGEVLAADVVRQLVAGKGFEFVDRGETSLRGFEDPVRLYEVRWSFDSPSADAAGGSG